MRHIFQNSFHDRSLHNGPRILSAYTAGGVGVSCFCSLLAFPCPHLVIAVLTAPGEIRPRGGPWFDAV